MHMTPPVEIKQAFVRRPVDADKRSVGIVTVVGGSERFIHAPVIAGLGARAAGAGLVQLVVPYASRLAAGALVPEATFSKLGTACIMPKADVVIVGMGLAVSDSSEVVVSRVLSGSMERFVVDADALSILAAWYRGSDGYALDKGKEFILTPHEGEAAKLLGWSRERVHGDRLAAAQEIAGRYGATVVLKGHETIVVSPDGKRVYRNTTGNPFMALGGMGDLLAGVIGARWAYLKGDPYLVAASSVWLHGAASDAIVAEAMDPSIAQTAARIGSMRVNLDT
jgi:hydroxyethylthiazole kinase-like uncharacterized protein yjeF